MKKRYFILPMLLLFSCSNSFQEQSLPSISSFDDKKSEDVSSSLASGSLSEGSSIFSSNVNSSFYSGINSKPTESQSQSINSSLNDNLTYVRSNINYNESSVDIVNPECGFYYPLYLYLNKSSNSPININAELSKKYSIIHLRVGIEAFSKNAGGSDIDLTSDALKALKTTLQNIKNLNMSCIIRFSYNMKGTIVGGKYLECEPSIELIKKHIKQICPILNEYKDSLLTIESGMLGPWGEQHSTKMAEDKTSIVTVMDTFLENLDNSLTINVRYPGAFIHYANAHGLINARLENINTFDFSSLKNFKRIGMFNDGYMADDIDFGTYTNRENEIDFLYHQTELTAFGGEVESSTDTIINANNTSSNVIDEAYRTHTTYLNDEYRKEVIDSWKSEKYEGNDKAYQNKTGYDYIKNHLGYRFVLKDSQITSVLNNTSYGKLKFIIENRGFANSIKSKKVQLVISNSVKTYNTDLDLDITKIKSLSQKEYEVTFFLPQDIEDGNYKVYLKITTDKNNYLPIKFANDNIYDNTLNANYLGDIKISNCKNKSSNFTSEIINSYSSLSFYDVGGGQSSRASITTSDIKKNGNLIDLISSEDIFKVNMKKGNYGADNYVDIKISNYQSNFTQMELSYYSSDNIVFSSYEGSNWNDCLFYKHTSPQGESKYSLDISTSAVYKNIIKNKKEFVLRLFLGHDQVVNNEMHFILKSISFFDPLSSEKLSITYKGSNEYLGSEFYQYIDKNSYITIKNNYFVFHNKKFKYYIDQNGKLYNEEEKIKITENLILTPIFE